MRSVILALGLALGAAGILPSATALAAASAHAGAGTPAVTSASLPIARYYQMVADPAHGHLFFSQGSTSTNDILVTDLSGNMVATIQGQAGVMGLTLSADGKTLYAALGSGDAVTAISTATLKQTASYPLPAGDSPVDVALQSGKLWVSYNTGTVSDAAIGDISLAAAAPAFQSQATMGGWYAAPELAADPQNTGVLVAAEPGQSPAAVASYDTTKDPAAVRASSTLFKNCSNEQDLVVQPGGSQFVLACSWPYNHYRYSTSDLSQQGYYPTSNYPDAVAADAAGVVAAGIDNPNQANLYIYPQDSSTPLNKYNLINPNDTADSLAARGLAWLPDGSKLFAVIADYPSGFTLDVIDSPALIGSTLTLTGPSTGHITRSITLTGTLTLASGSVPAGTPITITRTSTVSAPRTFTATTTATGGYALTDKPPAHGHYTYTASYRGGTYIAPATAAAVLNVVRMVPWMTLQAGRSSVPYDRTIRVVAHLGRTDGNRTVAIYARRLGSTKRILLKKGRVNSSGYLIVRYKAPHSTRFIVVFAGDAHYARRTVGRSVRVRARVSEFLTGYYGHARIGRTTFWLFRRTARMYVHATIAPNKARQCVRLQVQERYGPSWVTVGTTGCARLNRYSKTTVTYRLGRAALRARYRIRVDYTSPNASNASNHSGWRYLIVEP